MVMFSSPLANAPRSSNLNSIDGSIIASTKACSDHNNVDGASGHLQKLWFVMLIVI